MYKLQIYYSDLPDPVIPDEEFGSVEDAEEFFKSQMQLYITYNEDGSDRMLEPYYDILADDGQILPRTGLP